MFRKGKEEALNSRKPNGSNGVSVNRCLTVYINYTYKTRLFTHLHFISCIFWDLHLHLHNVVISKVHYESTPFLKFIQKIYDDSH